MVPMEIEIGNIPVTAMTTGSLRVCNVSSVWEEYVIDDGGLARVAKAVDYREVLR